MAHYQVQLERARNPDGSLGSFGLSILGGFGTKFPAVVCEVDPGGPADITGLVQVGDKLTHLNEEDLRQLTPKDLVSKIRIAPSPSSFTLIKDEELREQVFALLEKQRRRAAARQERAAAAAEVKGQKKLPVPGAGNDRKKKIMSKIIEVEPSVNVRGGHSGDIVQVYHNQIIGVVKPEDLDNDKERSPGRGSRSRSPKESSPAMSSDRDHRERSSVSPGSIHTHGSPNHIGNDSAVDSGGMDSSVTSGSTREQDSGVALQIPTTNGPTQVDKRSSLSEETSVESAQQPTSRESSEELSPGRVAASVVDPIKREELMKKYSPSRSASRKKDDPYTMAVSLARRLYMLDGFKKSEVAEKLADPSEFGKTVAKEYLKLFEFEGLSLDESLRQFLASFSLTGESQERERVMVHFSERFFSANPDYFPNADIVHGLTVALLLLNTDLHTDHGRSKMSLAQFINNLGGIGVKLPKDVLRVYYNNIRKNPLEWATDDVEEAGPNHTQSTAGNTSADEEENVRVYHVNIPGTFVEVEMPGNAPLFKEGFVLRKNIMDGPHKKVPRGKRTWKPYYAYLKGFLMYFGEPQGELRLEDTSNAIPICHCLAMGAADYNKKNCVLRITTSDWHSFLLQANNVTDMQQWIGAVNKASALYSSAPLPAPMSSSAHFARPTFPLAPTKNTQEQQIESHEAKIKSLEKEIEEHQAYKPTGPKAKHNLLQTWFDKFEFLQFQINCYRIYYASLTTSDLVNFNAPLPSGLVPSPSVSTLAVTGTSQDLDLHVNLRAHGTPPHSPSTYRKSSHADFRANDQSRSPLAQRKFKQ